MTRYYKFLDEKYHATNVTKFSYRRYLPKDGKPGKWLPEIEGDLEFCHNGYHATDAKHLLDWISAHLFEVEFDGEILNGDNKVCGRKMRLVREVTAWNEKTLRLFACWCVRQVWHLLTDERSRNVVEIAEKYANGLATKDELAAARAAARDAARDAAWETTEEAAWDAAWETTEEAAWDAAKAAAWAAAKAAAWDAAWDVAWDAAWDVARDAAWDAAWDAQNKRLIEMLGLEAKCKLTVKITILRPTRGG